MLNIYLLIQNDLETGPYTLEELLQLSLQSKDLIWVIGQSEDWQRPLEVPSLKPYFNAGTTEPEVKEEVLAAIAAKRFIGHISGVPSLSVTDQRYQAGFLDTKILKSTDKQHLMQDNASPLALPTTAKPQLEAPLQGNITAGAPGVHIPKVEAAKERDDAQQKSYEEVVEERRAGHEKPILAILSVVLILFVLNNYRNKEKTPEIAQPYATSPEVKAVPEPVKEKYIQAIPVVEQTTAPIDEGEAPAVTATEETSYEPEALSVDSFLDSIQQVVRQQDSKQYALRIIPPAVKKVVQKQSLQPSVAGLSSKAVRTATLKKKAPLHQQVALKSRYLQEANNKKLTGVEVTVQNNSPELLKSVSVDVFYYKKGQRLFDKETIYFSNVHPRQSLTMSLPGNKRANTARFQLGAITAAYKN